MAPPAARRDAAQPGFESLGPRGREAHRDLRHGDALRRLSIVGKRKLRRAFRRLRVQAIHAGLGPDFAHTSALVHLAGWARHSASGCTPEDREKQAFSDLLDSNALLLRELGVRD